MSSTSSSLVRYEAARAALAEAHRVDEVKDIRDKALAIAAYAKQANDTAMVEWATEIRVRAERRAGELLAGMDKATGTRGQLRGPSVIGGAQEEPPTAPTLSQLGIDKKQSSRWQKLAAVPAAQFEKAVEAAKEVAREVTTTAILRSTQAAAPRREASTESEFVESIFINHCVNAVGNLAAEWPEDRPIDPLIERLRRYLDHLERRRGSAAA